MNPFEKAQQLRAKGHDLHTKKNAYGKKGEMEWMSGGITFVMTAPPKVRDNGNLEVFMMAYKGILGLPLKDIDSFLFYNPPTGVRLEDGTVKVDEEAALKAIIEDAVLTAARVRGWDG